MEGLFSDVLMHDETLFIDESLFDYKYVPEKMPERDNEIKEIAESIKPLLSERRGSNLFIYGRPGIGKTASIKFVFNELKKTSSEVTPIHINCWSNQSTHAIALELARKSGLIFPPKGVPADLIIKNAIKKLKEKKGLIICFDEADRVNELSIIYQLLKELDNTNFILISNNNEWKAYIEPRLLSRLNLKNLEFKDYNEEQMNEILSRRAGMALRQGVINKELINLIAGKSKGDVRRGMALIIESARLAERDASREILKKHVENTIINLKDDAPTGLSNEEKRVFKAIKDNEGEISGRVYADYLNNEGELTLRSFRRYIKIIERMGLITIEGTGEGFHGKSRRLCIKK